MRCWWVNQNQTFRHEVGGGYLWSPKVNRDKSKNHFYETMREVSAGDLVFSFNNRKIMALGIAMGPAYTCPKPVEFGAAGAAWNEVGWRVDVKFKPLLRQIVPKDHMKLLQPLLPERYSPIRADGTGNQIYLAEIPLRMGEVMLGLIGSEGEAVRLNAEAHSRVKEEGVVAPADDILDRWDRELEKQVREARDLSVTEKEQVVKARRGQGLFKARVAGRETECRITKVSRPEHLIASHIKPWRVSSNEERIDGENGLLLTPSVDHLFDKGFISFKNNGELIVSGVADRPSLLKMGIPQSEGFHAGTFSRKQSEYLEYHRDTILLQARS